MRTNTAIDAHEKLLGSVEQKMKFVEAPLDVSTARFEAEVWQLK